MWRDIFSNFLLAVLVVFGIIGALFLIFLPLILFYFLEGSPEIFDPAWWQFLIQIIWFVFIGASVYTIVEG